MKTDDIYYIICILIRKCALNMNKRTTRSRNASPGLNGFLFQINVAIFLFIKYIKNIDKIRVEGEKEDVEIILENKNKYMVQAKSQMDIQKKNPNIISLLHKALNGLVESDAEDVERLIYATNFQDPLNNKDPDFLTYSGVTIKSYGDLNESSKNVIDAKLDEIVNSANSINRNKIWLVRIPFFGKDEGEKHKFIYEQIRMFLGSISERFNYVDFVNHWESIFINNGSLKFDVNITKNDLKVDLIFVGLQGKDPALNYRVLDVDEDDYDEACEKYRYFIDKMECDYEVVGKINSLYDDFKKSNKQVSKEDFVVKNGFKLAECIFAKKYDEESKIAHSDHINIIAAQIIAMTVLRNKWIINQIERKV